MIMERIQEAKAGFRSLTEAIDTTTAPGRMMMQMVGVFAEFERAILRERTKAGLDAARKQGRIGGRRPKLRPNQQDEIVTMVSAGPKLPLMLQDFSMLIQRRSRGFWPRPVPELQGEGGMHYTVLVQTVERLGILR
jgi:DNA invertase Pin-like site-specific DNA recombinase